jgi:hypothetical protein
LLGRFVGDYNSLLTRLNSRVRELKEILDAAEETPAHLVKRWMYDSSCLVHDFSLSNNKVAFDLYIGPIGWKLQLFGRGITAANYVKRLLSAREERYDQEGGRDVVAKWPLDAGLDVIREGLCQWIEWTIQQDKRLTSCACPPL